MWDGLGGTVAQIRAWLGLSAGADCRFIRAVLERHAEGEALSKYSQCGGKPKLTEGESKIAADCLERGLGREQKGSTAYIVSDWREKKGSTAVSVIWLVRLVWGREIA